MDHIIGQSPIEVGGPEDLTFQRTSIRIFSELYMRTASRLQVEMNKPQRIIQSVLDHNLKFSLGPHNIISAPKQKEVA